MKKEPQGKISLIDRTLPADVLQETKALLKVLDPQADLTRLEWVFRQVQELFRGKFPGYRACNTQYHDFGHTLDAYLASLRLLDGYSLSGGEVSFAQAEALLLAALLHDTGYIQEAQDKNGTGAKYTKNHVERSLRFLEKNSDRLKIYGGEVRLVSRMISCTGLAASTASVCFDNGNEILLGNILGTADLIGQMADRTYLEKLLFLYYEFREAGLEGYDTEFDILRKTLGFYEMARKRLSEQLGGVYKFAREYFAHRHSVDSNIYMEAIENHMNYIREIMKDHTGNFRKKLRRMDLEAAELNYLSLQSC